jgi:hypothetical protein
LFNKGGFMSIARKIYLFLGFFLVIFFFTTPVHGMDMAGTLGNGPCFDVVEKDGYVLAAQGCEVRVYPAGTDLQINGLTWQSYVSRMKFNTEIYGLELAGNILYVASSQGLSMVDITDPVSPGMLSSFPNPVSGTIRDVKVQGNYAYLAIYGAGIQVVDISNPLCPVKGKLVPLAGYNTLWRVTIDGNYLYAALATDKRMDILDITTPSSPRVVGSFAPEDASSTGFSSVAVRGDYAYLVEYYNGVRVVDIRNPASPAQVSAISGINANDIKVLGTYAYVSVRYQGFNVYDINASPGTMALAGQGTGFAGYNEGICPTTQYTFVSGDSFGFAVYKTLNPKSPGLMVQVPVLGGVDSLVARGNYLFVGAHNYGVWVVDISDRSNPKEVALIKNDGRNQGIDLSGNTLVFAGVWSGLNLVDVTNPASPQPKVLDFGDNINTVLADGNFVYTGAGIVDISNPSSPVYVSKSPYFYGRMTRFGTNYLLVAISDYYSPKGIHIIDITDKKNPTVVATYGNGTAYYDVAVVGNTAVGLSGYDVETIDLSQVSKPQFIARVSYAGSWVGYSLYSVGTTVYAAGGPAQGIKVLDVSTPSQIRQVDSGQVPTATGAYCQEVYAQDGYVYTGNKWGVYIFAQTGPTITPTPTTPTPTPTTPTPTPTTPTPTPTTPTPTPTTPTPTPTTPTPTPTTPTPTPTTPTPTPTTPTPTPTPTPAQTIWLSISSIPSGAGLYIDNNYEGKTPVTLIDLVPGYHDLKIVKQGYNIYETKFYARAGEKTSMNAILRKPTQQR